VVSAGEITGALRERIFSSLNRLQSEVDRNRSYTQSICEVFLTLTEAAGKGAKNLLPAVRLVERLAGAYSSLRTAKIKHETILKLPGPEEVGLSDIDKPEGADGT
jgi:hypothetical protein